MGGLLSTSREQVDCISMQQAAHQVRRNYIQRSGGDDRFESVEQVTEAIEKIGLESCNLIVGVDFTRSNEWTGRISFEGQCLHDIRGPPNPYQQVLAIISRKLSRFDEDGEIPFFGFGDASTRDRDVFSFYPDHRPCNGISEGLRRYEHIVPELRLSGPTSFAPIIEMAADTAKRSGYYHVLLIIADGQVTGLKGSSERLSFQEQRTVEAIVNASHVPLSIILVGVGDGPWNPIEQFVSSLPPRRFNNFQFVNFTDIMSMDAPEPTKEEQFALEVLTAMHSQYKATTKLQLDYEDVATTARAPLPPPSRNATGTLRLPDLQHIYADNFTNHPLEATLYNEICPVCSWNVKDMVFGCGHETCRGCGANMGACPICQQAIQARAEFEAANQPYAWRAAGR